MKSSFLIAARSAALAALCAFLIGHAAAPLRADKLGDTLDRALAVPALKGGATGVIVERLDDGKVLYERDSDTPLSPASNRKLFTSAAALELLGADYRFKTTVVAAAKPDADGMLHGNLWLRGAGDSLLAPADLDKMAKDLAAAGVKRINGDVVGDGSIFTDGPYSDGWEWDELPYYYAPQIAGLEVSQGVLAVHVTAGDKAGDPVKVVVDQPTAYLPIVNLATTGAADSSKDNCRITRPWDKNILNITGTVPLGGKADGLVTVLDPVHYASTVFRETLLRDGIAVTGAATVGKAPADASVELASHESVPMSSYIARMNKPSNNLLAESLVRVIGAVKGHGGNYWDGHIAEMDYFKTLDLTPGSIYFIDGSGLAQADVVAPRTVAMLLRAMHGQPNWKFYYDSLPIAGVDGSLYSRMKGTAAAGNIHAKTGSILRALALSGYVTSKRGDLYVFSIINNRYPGSDRDVRAAQDKFAVALAEGL